MKYTFIYGANKNMTAAQFHAIEHIKLTEKDATVYLTYPSQDKIPATDIKYLWLCAPCYVVRSFGRVEYITLADMQNASDDSAIKQTSIDAFQRQLTQDTINALYRLKEFLPKFYARATAQSHDYAEFAQMCIEKIHILNNAGLYIDTMSADPEDNIRELNYYDITIPQSVVDVQSKWFGKGGDAHKYYEYKYDTTLKDIINTLLNVAYYRSIDLPADIDFEVDGYTAC